MSESAPDRRVKLDITAVLISAIAAVPPTLMAAAALVVSLNTQGKVEKVEHATNSMKDALVKAALLEGQADGIKMEKSRADSEAFNRSKGAEDEKARQRAK